MAPFLRSQAAAYFLLPLAAACWAGNHIIARAAGGHVPPASLAVLRWIVIVVVVLPFALAHLRADWPKLKSNAGLMLLFAAVGGGAFGTLQFVALHFTTALNMGVVGSVAPAFIVAVSWLLFRDRLSGLQLLGVMISLTGVLAIVSRLDVARLASFSFNGGDLIIIANMMLWAIYSACLRLRPDIHPMTFMLSMAVIAGLGNVPFALTEYAFDYRLQYTGLTLVTLLYSAFIVAASWLLFRDRLSWRQLLGVMISLSGVLAIVSRLDVARLASLSFNGGDIIIIVNMVFWGIYCACLRLRPPVHPMSFLFALAGVSIVGGVPFAVWEYWAGYRLHPDALTIGAVLYAALFTSILAYVAWNRGIDIVGAPRASAFLHTIPLFAAVLATTILGEQLMLFHIVGFVLILAGVSLAARPSRNEPLRALAGDRPG